MQSGTLKGLPLFYYQQRRTQNEQIRRLGLVGDFDHPYLTLNKGYEARQIEENFRHQLGVPRKEMVNHPQHYSQGKYEPIDVINDWKLDFNLGNTIKYIARAKYKGKELEDLKKARFYLDDEIKAEAYYLTTSFASSSLSLANSSIVGSPPFSIQSLKYKISS